MLRFVTYLSEKDPEATSHTIVDFDGFVSVLDKHRYTKCTVENCKKKECQYKSSTAWSGVVLSLPRRKSVNVQAVTIIGMDVDRDIDDDKALAVIGRLEALDLRCLLYSTHSSRPGSWAFRLAIMPSRPILASEWSRFWDLLCAYLNVPGSDRRLRDISRLWFFPTCPTGSEPVWQVFDGAPIDVDMVLASAPLAPPAETSAPRALGAPNAAPASPTLLAHVRGLLRAHGPAVEGDGGDEHTMRVGQIGYDYDLIPEELWPLALEWNQDNEPPWSEADLARKIANGYQYPIGKDAPIGRFQWAMAQKLAPSSNPSPFTTIPAHYLTDAPKARRWLLRHPNTNQDGLLPLGRVGLLVADGGIGKTMALLSLAVAIAAGRPWLDHFPIGNDAQDRVLLLLAEEDDEEIHRRLYAIAQSYQLTTEERARVQARVVVLGLAGESVSLVVEQGGDIAASSVATALLEQLRDEGPWSLIALDPLSRIGGRNVEIDNAMATRTIQVAESFTKVPGNPTVLIAHHTSAVNAKDGTVRARGVTGISNAVRWESVLRAEDGDVSFRQRKSNYSRAMPEDVKLFRDDHGVLRAYTAVEIVQRDKETKRAVQAKDNVKIQDHATKIRHLQDVLIQAVLLAQAPITSQRELYGLMPFCRNSDRAEAVARLIAAGKLIKPDKQRGQYIVRAPSDSRESLPLPEPLPGSGPPSDSREPLPSERGVRGEKKTHSLMKKPGESLTTDSPDRSLPWHSPLTPRESLGSDWGANGIKK